MKKLIGVAGAACGGFLALIMLNLFIYGSDVNLTACATFGSCFGALVGLALYFKPTSFDSITADMTLGAFAMTALWTALASVNGLPASHAVAQYLEGAFVMAELGAISGYCYNAAIRVLGGKTNQ